MDVDVHLDLDGDFLWNFYCASLSYILQYSGFLLVNFVGVILWHVFNDITIPAEKLAVPILVCETLLAITFYLDCATSLCTLPIAALCVGAFTFWTRPGKLTIKDGASLYTGTFCQVFSWHFSINSHTWLTYYSWFSHGIVGKQVRISEVSASQGEKWQEKLRLCVATKGTKWPSRAHTRNERKQS